MNPQREHPSAFDVVNRWRPWFTSLAKYRHLNGWSDYVTAYGQTRVWFNGTVVTDPLWAFTQTDWCLLRQPFRHRWTRWEHVLNVMDQWGAILDYGCGTGEMLAWLQRRRPDWIYDGHDLESPHYAYAKHRGFGPSRDWQDHQYEIVTCFETLEHVRDPLGVVESMLKVIKPGGWLLWDFVDDPGGGNVATREERSEVLRRLGGVTGMGEYYRV